MKKYNIFTDLETDKIRNIFDLDDVLKVEDVYEYLSLGIIITSWDNTDYSKAEIVHVLQENGKRVMDSRRPTVYCKKTCENDKINELVKILSK